MSFGYHGRVLHVDLTTGALDVEHPEASFYRKYLGGSAMGVQYGLRMIPSRVDALDPGNALTVATSVVTGLPVSGTSRVTVTAKSPLTGGIGDSECGGMFATSLKASGYDAVVVHGRSPEPTYLWLHDGSAELRPAKHIWGLKTGESEAVILDELGDTRASVLQCGPAGENGVRFAGLISHSRHAAGRTGMGAVMGSKRLKAVVASGRAKADVADPAAVQRLAKRGAVQYEDSAVYGFGTFGTVSILRSQNAAGGLPSRNWESGTFDGWETLDGQHYTDTILKGRDTCYACVIRCKRVVEVSGPPFPVDPLYGGPEYETVAMFGSMCGIANLETVARAHQLCNQYGMDTISCGATVAWAIECFERGLLTSDDTGGLNLHFGDDEAVLQLTEMIGQRKGLGDLLAEGSARAARKLGRGSEALLSTSKGQEMPAHMPQVKPGLGLVYAVNAFGPDHMSSSHDPAYRSPSERMAELGLTDPQPTDRLNREKVRFARLTGHLYSCLDSLAVCAFAFGPAFQLYGPSDLVELVRAATGWDVSLSELMEVGERRAALMRTFNVREGLDPSSDALPSRLFDPLVGGASDGLRLDREEFQRAVQWYYEDSGWDPVTGMPKPEVLTRLGIEWVMEGFT